MRKCFLRGGALCLLLLAGCGGKGDNAALSVYPVTGTVTLANGQPVRGAQVRLTAKLGGPNPGGSDAFAVTDAEGNFKLQTMDNREGAMPGHYKVVVQPATNNPSVNKEALAHAQRTIPRIYWSEDTTTLEAEVKPEGTALNLQLR